MDTQELFLTIQNSTDYREDPAGFQINWKYIRNDEEKAVYILVQETKTRKDWRFNFQFLPRIYKYYGQRVAVHSGWYKLANILANYILYDLRYGELKEVSGYRFIFTGWSAGAAVAQIAGTIIQSKFFYPSVESILEHGKHDLTGQLEFVGYGQPAFCYGKKTVERMKAPFFGYINFLYQSDPIRFVVPFCSRYTNGQIIPEMQPQTWDEKHRIYGKAKLKPAEV